jgi:nucleotide-binding universal stress UspA family protein
LIALRKSQQASKKSLGIHKGSVAMVFSKILVALDYSPQSREICCHALGLAAMTGAQILLCSCVETEAMPQPLVSAEVGLYSNALAASYSPQILAQHLERAQENLQAYVQMAAAQGLTVEVRTLLGEAGGEICQLAEQWQADLIVLGRRGLKGISEVVWGSVSNHVVHNASCCVLVVQGEGLS